MKDMKYRFLIVLIGIVFNASLMAQSGGVLIGQKPESSPDASAILELFSSDKGLLIPRTTIISIVEPAKGLLIFDTDSTQFLYFDGTDWMSLVSKLDMTNANAEMQLLLNSKIDSVTNLFLDLDKMQALQMDTIISVIGESVSAQGLVNDSIFAKIAANLSSDTIQSLQIDTINSVIVETVSAQGLVNDSIFNTIAANMSSDTIQSFEIDTLKLILSQIDGEGLSSDTSILKVNASTGLAIIEDTVRIVTGDSAQVMVTTGDGNNVEWVDREEIGKPLLAGSNMIVDDIDGKNIVSLQDTVAIETLVFDNDSISAVAKAADWGTVAPDDSTSISTVSYTHKAIKEGGDDIGFNGNRNITRDIKIGSTTLKGQNVSTENIQEFLEAIFFPKSAPRIDVLTYASSSTPVLAYTTWKNISAPISLDWQVTNISKTVDGLVGAEYDITSIILKNDDSGADIAGSPSSSGDAVVTGTFSNITIDASGKDATVEWQKVVTMEVEDGLESVTTKDLVFTFSPAVEHVLGTPITSGSAYRVRTGAEIDLNVQVPLTVNEEILTTLTIDGNGVTIPDAFTTVPNANEKTEVFSVMFPHSEGLVETSTQIYAAKKEVSVVSTGQIYNTPQTKNTGAVYLVDKAFTGFIADTVTIVDNDFLTFTDTEVNLNPYGMLSTTDNGKKLTNSTGDKYFVAFAIPTYGDISKKYKIETFDVGQWNLDESSNSRVVTTSSGGFSNSYYVVFTSNKYDLNTDVTARIIKQ